MSLHSCLLCYYTIQLAAAVKKNRPLHNTRDEVKSPRYHPNFCLEANTPVLCNGSQPLLPTLISAIPLQSEIQQFFGLPCFQPVTQLSVKPFIKQPTVFINAFSLSGNSISKDFV